MLTLYLIDILSSVSTLALILAIFLAFILDLSDNANKTIQQAMVVTIAMCAFTYLAIPGHDTMHQMLSMHEYNKEASE